MTLVLIAAAWILLVSLAAGLCMAAQGGDEELRRLAVLAEDETPRRRRNLKIAA